MKYLPKTPVFYSDPPEFVPAFILKKAVSIFRTFSLLGRFLRLGLESEILRAAVEKGSQKFSKPFSREVMDCRKLPMVREKGKGNIILSG